MTRLLLLPPLVPDEHTSQMSTSGQRLTVPSGAMLPLAPGPSAQLPLASHFQQMVSVHLFATQHSSAITVQCPYSQICLACQEWREQIQ